MPKLISTITHPEFSANLDQWTLSRNVFEGGKAFLEEYLQPYSDDETAAQFEKRKSRSPIEAHAKAAIVDIKNAIYQRMVDIRREAGTSTYMRAIRGELAGVDGRSSTMSTYIGQSILTDLVSIGKVGVLIDRDVLPMEATLADSAGKNPYLVYYRAETIRSWDVDAKGRITKVLLKSTKYTDDPEYGLPSSTSETYKLFVKVGPNAVEYTEYEIVAGDSGAVQREITHQILKLERVPFVVFDIGKSLLEDVCNHQIALTNMCSSDVDYAIQSNYPFYTEQISAETIMAKMSQNAQIQKMIADGAEGAALTLLNKMRQEAANIDRVRTGNTVGRAYAKGLERPAFIAPPADPLLASMKKQDQLKEEIRQLINLSLLGLTATHASADSRSEQNRGMEAGLAFIGLELERGEREIAKIWANYEDKNVEPIVVYPTNYSLLTDDQRQEQAKAKLEMISKVPSITYQRQTLKEAVRISMGHKLNHDDLKAIDDEISKATIVVVDPEILRDDHEAGLVSDDTASRARGYPEGEAIKARKDKADRLAMTLKTQAAVADNPASRGGDGDNEAARLEKDVSQNRNFQGETKTRGDE